MKASAIIAEYNPFHSGHKYHIEQTKKLSGNDFVMVIMSGNFVQRGEVAICEKRERAKAAILGGADLVVELPSVWSCASAERFARAGAYIAVQSGIVDTLSFGCENDNIEALTAAARILNDGVYAREIKEYYDQNLCSYPQARSAIVKAHFDGFTDELMTKPNNILAIEYIRALLSFKSDIKPLGIKRVGAAHDTAHQNGKYTSALTIRNIIRSGKDYSPFVSKETFDILENAANENRFPARYSRLESAILADLRKKEPIDFANVPDIAEGIEYRILEAVKSACSLEELFDLVKTKRYTHARIRRVILSSFLGFTSEQVSSLPPYIRVLALNDNGRQMLKEMKSKFFFPIIMKYSDTKYLDNSARDIFMLESRATDLFNLSLPIIRECGTDMTDPIIYLPNS